MIIICMIIEGHINDCSEANHAHVMKFLPLYTKITLVVWRELSIVSIVRTVYLHLFT
jgi:hypothetical protein